MRFLSVLLLALATLLPVTHASTRHWTQVEVEPMKTSIYVGSVRLNVEAFQRSGDTFTSSYEAKVFPWVFWGESGQITLRVPATDLDRLARGEVIDFTGDAISQKGKSRQITGRAYPAGADTGKIKVRIHVDDVELIFNGNYRFSPSRAG